MSKSYKLLNHTEPISVDEIEKLYDGYWVYVVNAQFAENGQLISGIPVVCGDCQFAGAEDGIYDKYRSEEYGQREELILFHPDGFIASLQILREANA